MISSIASFVPTYARSGIRNPQRFLNSAAAQFVKIKVGVAVNDIKKYPGNIFENIIEKEQDANQKTIIIKRDGALFKYVNSFLVNDQLPRDKQGLIALDKSTLKGLKAEAEFYGLDALVEECNQHKKDAVDLQSYMTIRKYMQQRRHNDNMEIEYSSPLIESLQEACAPFYVTGQLGWRSATIYKDSTVHNLKIDELLANATQSPFGKGTKTVTDTTVRNSFEIPASKLDREGLSRVASEIKLPGFAPLLNVELRPYKLVIYKEGGHFDAHRDTVRGDGHIGTLVIVLNSEYTGGELEVSHGGRTETVTGAYSWVAMYGDCLHKINPVTSGTRVSLIYDIYGTAREAEEDRFTIEQHFWQCMREEVPVSPHPFLRDRARFTAIKKAINAELKTFKSLIITLQHLYPECQSSPAFLKGGDRALYDLLSEQYDVQVVATTIFSCHDFDRPEEDYIGSALYSPAIVRQAVCHDSTSHYDSSEDEDEEVCTDEDVEHFDGTSTKLVVTRQFEEAGLLDYTPYAEQAGNEPRDEVRVYLVAGLRVSKKAKKPSKKEITK